MGGGRVLHSMYRARQPIPIHGGPRGNRPAATAPRTLQLNPDAPQESTHTLPATQPPPPPPPPPPRGEGACLCALSSAIDRTTATGDSGHTERSVRTSARVDSGVCAPSRTRYGGESPGLPAALLPPPSSPPALPSPSPAAPAAAPAAAWSAVALSSASCASRQTWKRPGREDARRPASADAAVTRVRPWRRRTPAAASAAAALSAWCSPTSPSSRSADGQAGT